MDISDFSLHKSIYLITINVALQEIILQICFLKILCLCCLDVLGHFKLDRTNSCMRFGRKTLCCYVVLGTSCHVGRTGGYRAEHLEGKDSRNVDEKVVSVT